jgi:predicted ribosome quality control (RQC) complex YloA/Tae2 family protein
VRHHLGKVAPKQAYAKFTANLRRLPQARAVIVALAVEGLFIAKQLEEISALLPAQNLGWAFPNETTAALLLQTQSGIQNLVLEYRAPSPALYLSRAKLSGEPRNAFQRGLELRAKGDLQAIAQLKLDRVVWLEFAPSKGFVSTEAIRLLFELTGRNANLLLLEPQTSPVLSLDRGGAAEQPGGLHHGNNDDLSHQPLHAKIILAAREITTTRNRFRTVRTGGVYTPPPPYQKLDPRYATDAELETALANLPVPSWGKHIDGLGPTLLRELEHRLEQQGNPVAALRDLVANPSLSSLATLSEQAKARAQAERTSALQHLLREPLQKRLKLLEKQHQDLNRAEENALLALEWREHAETLLAYSRLVPSGASQTELPSLYGADTVQIALEPTLSAAQNANLLFAKAKRREEVLTKLLLREPERQAQFAQTQALLNDLETASESRLRELLEQHNPNPEAPPPVGMRYRTSGGFEVLVGRNSKENELLTHRIASSLDLWFHVQGYPGSHTILRAKQKEVPFSDILEAAAIAAHHSKARGSTNVAVDYLFAKNVWKPKGAKAGAVYFTQQKTVVVEPKLPT